MFADITILWEWEFDEDFIRIFDRKCQQFQLQSYLVQPYNQPKVVEELKRGDFNARVVLDRASDNQPAFEPLIKKLLANGAVFLNHPDKLATALDKAVMHQKLADNDVRVPYTIILSPYRDWTKIKIGELIRLGEPFIIKPATGGGGVGVEANAKTLFDIVKAREGRSREKFLLQEKVLPAHFGDRRAWFRTYYVCGEILSCWWDDQSHIYFRVSPEEEKIYGLERLKTVAQKIAEISQLDFFSAEIAIVDRETFVVVDYVNDQCDMRLKSRFVDGVPDDVVEEIAFYLARFVQKTISAMPRNLRLAEG
ncbi:hypothetical protein L0222_11825 [bacterium]|nr:hypothetical protein [bacterium]